MSTGDPGFVHEAALYGSDAELLDAAVPFLADGVAAGDTLVFSGSARAADLVCSALPEPDRVTFLKDGYQRPAAIVQTLLDLFTERRHRSLPGRVRMAGEVFAADAPGAWEPWAHYEAVINDLYREFAVTGRCLYDTRTTSPDVLLDVERTHPLLVTAGTRHVNDRYADPVTFLGERPAPVPDPLELAEPVVRLTAPLPAVARLAVTRAAIGTLLDDDAVQGLVFGVSEVVTNALIHGRAPVELRIWVAPRRVVATVHDSGPGPTDPRAGLVRTGPEDVGLGLWSTHLLCQQVVQYADQDGFTVRLTASPSDS